MYVTIVTNDPQMKEILLNRHKEDVVGVIDPTKTNYWLPLPKGCRIIIDESARIQLRELLSQYPETD